MTPTRRRFLAVCGAALAVLVLFLLLPVVLNAVGGLEGMRATIASDEMFSLVAPGDIGVFYIAVITVNALIGIVAWLARKAGLGTRVVKTKGVGRRLSIVEGSPVDSQPAPSLTAWMQFTAPPGARRNDGHRVAASSIL